MCACVGFVRFKYLHVEIDWDYAVGRYYCVFYRFLMCFIWEYFVLGSSEVGLNGINIILNSDSRRIFRRQQAGWRVETVHQMSIRQPVAKGQKSRDCDNTSNYINLFLTSLRMAKLDPTFVLSIHLMCFKILFMSWDCPPNSSFTPAIFFNDIAIEFRAQ